MTKLLPSIVALEKSLNSVQLNGRIRVFISREQLRLFARILLDFVEVDEHWYLGQYSEARESIARGEYSSAKEHFQSIGYFNGYLPQLATVNEGWYKSQYHDIRMAVDEGKLHSIIQHFANFGYAEGRFPSKEVAEKFSPLFRPSSQQTMGKINIALISSPSLELSTPTVK
ncbi:hypothetical protein [Nitrospirillum amazonense]|uniref:hypothetical protein n=1 Tax=Nitrospirillum amazonense TaxID=28077 RepID=UPI0011A549F2|nr:hypothetical protein [Nitrospirillum amazonense]